MTKTNRSRRPIAVDALLRSGAGKHGDKRTKRLRDRSSQKRSAIRDSY